MNNVITLDFKKGKFADYEKRMLVEMEPEVFIPMSFVQRAGVDQVTYDLSGFVPLTNIGETLSPDRAFKYLDQVIKALLVAGEYLIEPAKISLNKSTVFVGKGGEVKIMYLPAEIEMRDDEAAGGENTMNKNLRGFIGELEDGYITVNTKNYLDSTCKLLDENCSVADLLRHISRVRREVNLGGIG